MGTHPLIYIRTDANNKIATGHMMRCLSIAKACLLMGMQVCFVVSDNESRSLFHSFIEDNFSQKDRSFPSVCLLQTAVYNDLEQELSELTCMLVTNKVSLFLVDSYFATPGYLSAITKITKTAYLDDLRSFDPDVDLLINYDIIPQKSLAEYKAFYQSPKQCLLGGLYTPLRSQFQNSHFTIRKFGTDIPKPVILVTTGGSDPYHFTLRFLQAACHLPVSFHVVVGAFNTDKETLSCFAANYSDTIILHEQVTDMASLMSDCDFAISAAGTTLYELCALGIPSVSYTMADNQITTAAVFEEEGAIYYAGDIRLKEEVIPEILRRLEEITLMSDNFSKRMSAHKTMRGLVDTKGASRIAEALFLCME